MTENKGFPTEFIDLPSKGWFYPENSPLTSGKVEMKYMSAHEEDILTSTSLLQKGLVIDALMKSLLVDKTISYDDFLLGDRNALILAARILGYGKDYAVAIECPECKKKAEKIVDLEKLPVKNGDFSPEHKGKNEFSLQLPATKRIITFKLLTNGDDKLVNKEAEAIQKATKSDILPLITTRMRASILTIDGDATKGKINQFIQEMPARDSRAFREYGTKMMPDIDMRVDFACPYCSFSNLLEIPLDANFFWPRSEV